MTMAILLVALKSLLVAAAALFLLRLTHTRSAAQRSTIAHLGLLALVALPIGSLALPTLALSLPAPVARLVAIEPAEKVAPSGQPGTDTPSVSAAGEQATRSAPSFFSLLAGYARYAYLLPTFALLALTLVALLRLVGLRARAEVLVDPVWLSALARAQRRMGFKNGTALLASDELGSPVSWGLMRPVILLNDAAVLAPDQAEAIIAHELAHVVHFDWAKLILARVATAMFWFNPMAWMLAREAHQLREEAADDAVLAADIAGPDYAALLIGVARHQCRGALLGAHGVAPSASSLGRRVRRVLDQNPARGPSGRSWVAGFATGMLTMAVPLAAVTIVPDRAAVATIQPPGAIPHIGRPSAMPASHEVARQVSTGEYAAHPLSVASAADAGSRPAVDDQLGSVDQPDDGDTVDVMHAAGVSEQYRRAMAQAGFPDLSFSQLVGARGVGVSAEFARAMRATGMSLTIEDVVEARAMGLSPTYIAEMRRLGINGTLDDYQGMRSVGVTANFVQKLRRRGINITSPDKLTDLRAANDDPDPDPDP